MGAARRRLGPILRNRSPIIVLALLAPALAWTVGCGRAGGDDPTAIHKLLQEEVEAINARDLKALSGIWSQDPGILLFDVSPPGRFQGWDRIGRSFKEFFDRLSEIHLKVDGVRVTVEGSLAYATYDWTMTGRMGSYVVDDRGQATAVYRKESGGWRLVHAHYSAAPPGAAAAPTATPAPPGPQTPTAGTAGAGGAAVPGTKSPAPSAPAASPSPHRPGRAGAPGASPSPPP
jgi:ketosteroid isomerase-like protein